jgi:hypothetical protein
MEIKLLSGSLALLFLTVSLVKAEEIEEKPLVYKVKFFLALTTVKFCGTWEKQKHYQSDQPIILTYVNQTILT